MESWKMYFKYYMHIQLCGGDKIQVLYSKLSVDYRLMKWKQTYPITLHFLSCFICFVVFIYSIIQPWLVFVTNQFRFNVGLQFMKIRKCLLVNRQLHRESAHKDAYNSLVCSMNEWIFPHSHRLVWKHRKELPCSAMPVTRLDTCICLTSAYITDGSHWRQICINFLHSCI